MSTSALLLMFGIVFQVSHGIKVNVQQDGKLCLYADLMLNFSVSYKVADNKNQTAVFQLPADATTYGSKCDATSSTLKLNFGKGHSWSMDFSTNGVNYQADLITFSYNLGDSTYFPNSLSNETLTVTRKPEITNVVKDTSYSCKTEDIIKAGAVKMTLWNVLFQAFVSDGSESETVTSCAADQSVYKITQTTSPTTPTKTTPTTLTLTTTPKTTPTTTTPKTTPTTTTPKTTPTTTTPKTTPTTTTPKTTPTTTTPKTTPTTTTPKTTPTTTTPTTTPKTTPTTTPKTTPVPTLPVPTIGNYSFKPNASSPACLLANFGLRLGIKQGEKLQEMNFDPNEANFSGSCGINSSELVLMSKEMTIKFTFNSDTKNFRLHALNVTAGGFNDYNSNLSLWEASIGSSYMCNKEQNFNISDNLIIYTFNLQVQPFGVKKGVFSTAHECSLDDTSILVPIIVGAALAGLILIVVIAYVIGRRKTYVGYQTL